MDAVIRWIPIALGLASQFSVLTSGNWVFVLLGGLGCVLLGAKLRG